MIKYIWLTVSVISFLPIQSMEISDDDKKIEIFKLDVLPTESTNSPLAPTFSNPFKIIKKVAQEINKGGKWFVTPLCQSPLASQGSVTESIRFDDKPIEKDMPLISQPHSWHTTPLNIALASYATVKLISRYGKPVMKSTVSLITNYPGTFIGITGFISLLSGIVLGQFYRAEYEDKNRELNAKMRKLEKEKADLAMQIAMQPRPIVYITQPTQEQMEAQRNQEKDMYQRWQRAEQEKEHLRERERASHTTIVKLGNDVMEMENKRRAQELASRASKYKLEDNIAVLTREFNGLKQQFKDMAVMYNTEKECTSQMTDIVQKQRRENIELMNKIKELKNQIEQYEMQSSFIPINSTCESPDYSLNNSFTEGHLAIEPLPAITIPEIEEKNEMRHGCFPNLNDGNIDGLD